MRKYAAAVFSAGLLLLGFAIGYLEGKRVADSWYWSHAKEFVGYGYVGAVPNDGRIYCADLIGAVRVSWSESGSVCHTSVAERIDPKY